MGRLMRWYPLTDAPVTHRNLNIAPSSSDSVVAAAWIKGAVMAVTSAGLVWKMDPTTDRLSSTKMLEGDTIDHVAIGAAGRVLVSSFSETDLRIFDCASVLNGQRTSCESKTVGSQRTTAIDLNDAKSIVAFAAENGRVQIVGFGSNPFNKEIRAADGEHVVSVALSGDADRVAIGTESGRVIVADLESVAKFEAPRQVKSISSMAWSPTGLLATACDTNAICMWNIQEASLTNQTNIDASPSPLSLLNGHARLSGHTDIVRSIAFAPSGSSLVSISDDDSLLLWSVNVADQSSVGIDLIGGESPADIALSADEKWLAAADSKAAIHIMDVATWESRGILKTPLGTIVSIAWSPLSATFAVGDKTGQIAVQAWPDDGKQASFPAAPLYVLRWLRDGSGVVTAGATNGNIEMHLLDGGAAEGFTGAHPDSVNGLAVSPDGKALLSADAEGNVVRWKIADRNVLGNIRRAPPSRDTVIFNLRGDRYLVAGNDGDVLVFDLDGSKPPIRCASSNRQLDAADFVVGDTMVVAISADAVPLLHVWTLSATCDPYLSVPLVLGANGSPAIRNRTRLVAFDRGRSVVATAASGALALIKLDPKIWQMRALGLAADVSHVQ
jgi:WD40 repeat protein